MLISAVVPLSHQVGLAPNIMSGMCISKTSSCNNYQVMIIGLTIAIWLSHGVIGWRGPVIGQDFLCRSSTIEPQVLEGFIVLQLCCPLMAALPQKTLWHPRVPLYRDAIFQDGQEISTKLKHMVKDSLKIVKLPISGQRLPLNRKCVCLDLQFFLSPLSTYSGLLISRQQNMFLTLKFIFSSL